jgi:transketolase
MRDTARKVVLERGAYNIRRHIINTIISNGEGHGGPSLSCADIMSVLYLGIMKIDVENPDAIENDRFVLSAGHKCLALYGALVEKGLVDERVLSTYNELGSAVPGHPDATKLRGVDFSTGSLGHGLALGCGYAVAAKMLGRGYRTYVLMGDGEQGEGSNWEAAGFAVHNKLDNLIGIIDENGLQINGRICDICQPAPLDDRYRAFGWSVRVVDGHDVCALYETLTEAPFEPGRPSMIIAKTVKGKGLSFAEDNVAYHHWHPGKEEAEKAARELEESGRRWL